MGKGRILFVITGLARAGAETQVVQLAKRLALRGWKVALISVTPPKDFVEELENAGVSVRSLRVRSKFEVFKAFRLVREVRAFRPHIVHSHMVHANILARLTRLFAPIPILICTAHNIDERGRRGSGKLRIFLYRITDPLCDLTTQVSQAGLERYIQIRAASKNKIRYIPNGVDIAQFSPDEKVRTIVRRNLGFNAEFLWLAAGRFDPQKDYPTLLRAFAEVLKERPSTYLLIAGDGPLRPVMKALSEELVIADHVRFLGIRRDMPELMKAADAYVLSSSWEGMPMVLLEAQASGLPVVATNVGGNREIVRDGVTGYLVPPKNPKALASAMLRVIQLPEEERRKMGCNARKHVEENFNLARVVDMWEALYKELLTKKGVRVE